MTCTSSNYHEAPELVSSKDGILRNSNLNPINTPATTEYADGKPYLPSYGTRHSPRADFGRASSKSPAAGLCCACGSLGGQLAYHGETRLRTSYQCLPACLNGFD